MPDFDDKVLCARCGESVRVLAMDAHQRGPACRSTVEIEKLRAEGLMPLPNPADPEVWMLMLLQGLGIRCDYEAVVKSSRRTWKPFEHGYVAPEWAVVTLRCYRSRTEPASKAERALRVLLADEEKRAEIVVLNRLGGESAARARLREFTGEGPHTKEEPDDDESD